jgi:hypothetical protein
MRSAIDVSAVVLGRVVEPVELLQVQGDT